MKTWAAQDAGIKAGEAVGARMRTDVESSTPSPYRTAWANIVATFFGAGYGKPGPGTWGSVAALLLWAGFAWGAHPSRAALAIALIAGITVSIVAGVPAATIAARESGRKDPQFVVIDEVAGQWIALLGCPVEWRHALLCLVLFRLFDMTKPPPVRQLEYLPEGWGIVFDDVAAGLYSVGVAALLRLWF